MKKPPILNFICPINSTNYTKPFYYSWDLNLNLTRINESIIPFIEIKATNIAELYTKTEIEREKDDDIQGMLETQTKTFITREEDDEKIELLELLTKTKVKRESDDE